MNILVYTYVLFTAGNILNYSFSGDFCNFVSIWTRIASLSQAKLCQLPKDPKEFQERKKQSFFCPLSTEAGIAKDTKENS